MPRTFVRTVWAALWQVPLGKSFAELNADEKNSVSHRKHALQALLDVLRQEKE